MQKKDLEQELDLTDNLKSLATAYEQISVMKMQEIRGSVVQTRTFMAGLSDLYYAISSSYRKQLQQLLEEQKKAKEKGMTDPRFKKNGREAYVLLSANNKLYGDIVPKTISLFLEKVETSSADL